MIKKVVKFIYLGLFFKILKLFPIKKNKIIFSSFYGKQYSGDPKIIYETLLNLNTEYEFIWVFNSFVTDKKLMKSKIVKRYSFEHLYYLATSKYRIDNCQESFYLKPKEETVYIQTWHGTPLKKIAQDIDDKSFDNIKKDWLKDANYWNYLFSSSPLIGDILSKAFLINRNVILETGYPRNEKLLKFSTSEKNEIMQKLELPLNKKIILYAPTFRDDEKDSFNINLTYKKLFDALSSEYIILIRMHSNIKNITNSIFDNKFIYNLSEYDDIHDLYIISDILITDYSSVFFDFSILNRPMIFYPYDIEKYRDSLRGFYFNYFKTVPGNIVYKEDDLIKEILDMNQNLDSILDKIKIFNLKFNSNKTYSTTDILQKIGLIE